MKRKNLLLVATGILCLILTSCSSPGDADKTDKTVKTEKTVEAEKTVETETTETVTDNSAAIDLDEIDWKNDPRIGKVQPGYYKRVGISKDGETYEEMLEFRETAGRGFLIINDDGTAVFDLDGEKTEYVYDEFKLYLTEDTEKTSGASYVFIGGRLIVDDGTTITQYLKLSDEEVEAYSDNAENAEKDK